MPRTREDPVTNGDNGNGNGAWTAPPDYDRLLPTGAADDFIGRIEQESMALRLGRVLRMSEAQESIPVVAFRPSAKWTSGYGARKPATEVRWTAVEIRAEEVAAVVPVPNAWIMDAGFDVEGQVERELANAVAYAIDDAILWGNDAPASFPTGGVVAFSSSHTGSDALDTISEGMSELEGQGVGVDGIASGPAIGTALRAAYREAAALPGQAPVDMIYGVPVARSLHWDPAAGDAIIGGWQYLAIGMREDITFGTSTDGVLLDEGGEIIASAFQDNVTLVKIYARLGCAIGQPMAPGPGSQDPVKPFATADWTT